MLVLCLMPSCGKVIQSDVPFPSKPHDDMAISIDEAENVLLDVMNQIGNMKTKSGNVAARTIANKYSVNLSAGTKAVSTEVPIHIFNFENESGFAIMSGDKRIPPLLAYTFEGNMKEGEHIDDPGLALYISKLNAYCRNVIDTISLDVPGMDSLLNLNIVEMVNGFCPVKWFQTSPYNYYCPNLDGYLTIAGCVAVAVAQLMCTYRYPYSYDGYDFDWEKMIDASAAVEEAMKPDPPSWFNDDSTAQHFNPQSLDTDPLQIDTAAVLQIARLMQLLGSEENLDMDYGQFSSSAPLENIITALNNFGYSSPGISYAPVSLDERHAVKQKVIEELKSGFYCVMAGAEVGIYDSPFIPREDSGGPSFGCHSWLVHGFMEIEQKFFLEEIHPFSLKYDYLLCNFGWCGGCDGFYLYDVFDTEEGPVFDDVDVKSHEVDYGNYSSSLSYVIGIRK